MNTKHTPGPWRVEQTTTKFRLLCSDGAILAINGGMIPVKADASLIAAAPDLLDALKGLARIVEAFSYTTQLGKTQRERLETARAILKRIEG